MSNDFLAELRFFGITSSPAFVRTPEGNGVAERFIRTLKNNFCGVWTCSTVEYPAPLEIETTSTTRSCVDRGGGDGSRRFRSD